MGRLPTLAFLVVLTLSSSIHAQSPQVSFSDDLSVGGTVTAGEGIVFPDGTVQTTAAGGVADSSLTANGGLYSNRIIEFTPPLPYVEVCFKDGGFTFDIHTGNGESTTGGNCEPGDKGWVIERDERSAVRWDQARAECLLNDMRLPEPFEFYFSCTRDASLGLINMQVGNEWVSNNATLLHLGSVAGSASHIAGDGNCNYGSVGWIGRNDDLARSYSFRCVR